MGRNGRSGDNRSIALRITNDCRLRSLRWVDTGGTHQSGPDAEGLWSVKEGVFVVIRGVPKATADARATRDKVSPYVWEVGVRWTDIPNVQSQKCVSPHL